MLIPSWNGRPRVHKSPRIYRKPLFETGELQICVTVWYIFGFFNTALTIKVIGISSQAYFENVGQTYLQVAMFE